MTMSYAALRKALPKPAGRTVASCTAFLRRLARGPAAYHIDERPQDITLIKGGAPAYDDEAAAWLDVQVSRCFKVLGEERAWGVYGEAFEQASGVLDNPRRKKDAAPAKPSGPSPVDLIKALQAAAEKLPRNWGHPAPSLGDEVDHVLGSAEINAMETMHELREGQDPNRFAEWTLASISDLLANGDFSRETMNWFKSFGVRY